jgi:hypothetical protein
MSNPDLPPEILDCVVDLLRCQPEVLKRCCLISKSWVARIRKHLFAEITFQTEEHLISWKEMFPDPSTSPAHYAKTLSVSCSQVVVAADAEPGGWIKSFSRVVHLAVHSQARIANGSFSLVPFHGISPDIKYLRATVPALPSSWIIDLSLSFPLLEDLAVRMVTSYAVLTDSGDSPNRLSTAAQPPGPPMFTGSLKLYMKGGMVPVTRRLLSLPGGIHFRKLTLTCFRETADHLAIMALVERCSHTLESIYISEIGCTSIRHVRPH